MESVSIFVSVSNSNLSIFRLEARTFSSKQLMREHTGNLKPVSFNFFQSQWDHSVHKTFMHVLSEDQCSFNDIPTHHETYTILSLNKIFPVLSHSTECPEPVYQLKIE